MSLITSLIDMLFSLLGYVPARDYVRKTHLHSVIELAIDSEENLKCKLDNVNRELDRLEKLLETANHTK